MDTTELPPDDRPPTTPPRRVNRGLLWAAALATVVLTVATIVAFVGSGDGGSDVQKIDPNATAPSGLDPAGTDVTGQDLPAVGYTTFDGEPRTLAVDGKPLLINFWASTCTPCLKEMPDLQEAYDANGGAVDFVGLQVAERAESGLAMIQRTGISYPVGRDAGAEAFRALGGASLPRTVVVRADGTIAYSHTGALTAAQLQDAIDQASGG